MKEEFECPLLNKKIEIGECYDIQMVLESFIHEKILNFDLNKENAKKLCPKCHFNQLAPPSTE